LVFARSFIKRSFSDGNILAENSEPVSTNNRGTENVILGLPVNLQSEEIREHSDSAPEISTNETGLSYSRFVPEFCITFHVKLFLIVFCSTVIFLFIFVTDCFCQSMPQPQSPLLNLEK
jgi:hypothetical protein